MELQLGGSRCFFSLRVLGNAVEDILFILSFTSMPSLEIVYNDLIREKNKEERTTEIKLAQGIRGRDF